MELNDPKEGASEPDQQPLWQRIFAILKPRLAERFRILDVADPQQTIDGIKRDVEFRGFNLWILVFSIFICAIGLNVDSTAVVIGAMLISPLMGPIMGIGLGVGVQDGATFRTSLSSLAVAAGIAILTSALYFMVSPIHEASSELLARTHPNFLDVMVALFGGLAGIMAGSRKEKSNVIPGVAIATALMPPLCTAGYGLANGEWNFLIGGFYLFLINSMLIATATALVIRYLRFPVVQLVDTATELKVKRWFTILLLALVVPSTYIFYTTVTTSIEDGRISAFVADRVNYPGTEIVGQTIEREGEVPRLNIVLLGEFVPEPTIVQWREDFARLVPGVAFNVVQNSRDDAGLAELERMVDLYAQGREELSGKDREIADLRAEIKAREEATARSMRNALPSGLAEEIFVQYPDVEVVEWGHIEDARRDSTGLFRLAGAPYVAVSWCQDVDSATRATQSNVIESFLRVRLDAPALSVVYR
ncbi:MAG: DUF389 domain-containing protein [Flavobacteriales bacterium]|nr:DUF389 domain-containing protein [Flavobacteriales bacterium]